MFSIKNLLFSSIAMISLSSIVHAEVSNEIHNRCKDVSDYIGCVKANSKVNKLNFFQEKKPKTLKLTEEQKIKWCDYGDWNETYMQSKVKPCIRNLEALGPKAISNLSFEIHSRCSTAKEFDIYLGCLDKLGQDTSKFNKVESLLSKKAREEDQKSKEVFYHKGKTYIASKICPSDQNMYWVITGLFRKKVSEMGCMTSEQFKLAKMEMQIKGLKRAIRTNALNDASNTINNMIQQQQINTNTYNSNFGY